MRKQQPLNHISIMAEPKVYPSERVTEHVVKLSLCDVYSPKVWVTQTHFWPLPEGISFERCYEILKEGLARTLSEIPALAGTIGRLSDDPRDLCVNVGSDAHVEFGHEDLSSKDSIPSYSATKTAGFPLTDLVMPLSQPITLAPVFEGCRMLTAKLNLLDGGLALTFGFNHLLSDAATVAEVERIWSQHTRDVSLGRLGQHKPSIAEADIRKRLSTAVPGVGEFKDEHWKVFPTTHSQLNLPRSAVDKEAALTALEQAKKAYLASLSQEVEETNWCVWKFTGDSLARLKKDAAGPDVTQWISTMDALIGLFWSRLAFTKQKSKEGYETSLVLFPINIRHRLQTPIDSQYVGNAVDIISTEHSLSELEDSSAGLSTAARCVRKAVSSWTESQWTAWLSMAATLPNDEAICPNPLQLLATHNMGFNDYSKSQSNVLDWGPELGRIERTRYMKPASSLANCATVVIVHPRLPDGGLEVATTLTHTIGLALQNDAVFSAYSELVCVYP